MLYVGTSGYSYDDWIGTFYSSDIKKGEMLERYSSIFKFTEINSTYYSMPNWFMMSNLVKKTPEDFKFTVKLHSSMTHTKTADESTYKSFNEALAPLFENDRMGCVVAQFPYSFHLNDSNIDYIKRIREHFSRVPLSVEFRNNEWSNTEIFKMLSKEQVGFICVDEPDIKGLIKRVTVVTSPIGYIRFHGRNAQKWYNHNESYERYNYLYNEHELKEWLPRIEYIHKNTDITFIAFNNHFKAQGAVNASMLQRLLNEK